MTYKLYKSPKYGRVYGESLPTPIGRLAWVYLDKKKPAMEPQPGQQKAADKYEVTLILKEGDQANEKFFKELGAMAKEMEELYNKGNSVKVTLGSLLKSGNAQDTEKYTYYKDALLLVARNEKDIICVSSDGASHVPADYFKGGMKARLQVCPHMGPTGLSFKLEIVQFAGDDGTRFAGGAYVPQNLMTKLEGIQGELAVQGVVEAPEGEMEPIEVESAPPTLAPANVAKPLYTEEKVPEKVSAVATQTTQPAAKPATNLVQNLRANAASKVKGKSAAINIL